MANFKSATQIAELFDNYEDVRKVNSKPMDRLGRNDKILTYSGVKEKENGFGKTSPRLGASVPESTRERTFEKRVIQRCYHCNMPGHIKAVCPKLIKNKMTETLNNIEGNENPDFLNSYTTKGSVNGHEVDILRDTGATIGLVVVAPHSWRNTGLKPYYKRPEHVNVIINDETQNSLADQELEIPYLENNSLVYDFEDVIQASELNKHLHDKQMDRLRELLNKYSKCFSNNPGLTNLVEHEIQLVSDQPVRTKPYRMSHRQNEILKNEINRMLKLGIIEVGESDYMPPMILVEVAGKEPRLCIDYRKLNGIIRTEYFSLPNIEERLETVSAVKFITVLIVSKGYWLIELSKTAQRDSAFCTSFGTYRPLRMSFGLKNAPYFCSKLMA
ncbi:retrovirus-related Pol polyprotein from transposon 412 [Trichonephila clavipes]|nr:retrovirus-related Pol polyprotein from transposon 412 [Trichonephila clavipes]